METNSPSRPAIATAFVVVCLIWGSTWLAIKIGLTSVPPLLAVSLRFFIACFVLFLLTVIQEQKLPREKEFWKLSAVISMNAFAVPYGLVYLGQKDVPTGLSSILFTTYPFWVALFSHLRLANERMTAAKWIGMIIGFAGIVVIFSKEITIESPHPLLGMLAILASAVLQAFALVTLKKHGRHYSPVAINLSSMSIGAVILFAASLGTEDYSKTVFDTTAVSSLLYLATFGTVGTFVTYFWLLKHVQAVMLSFTSFVTPIIAIVLGALALKERLAPEILLGASLVLLGILWANTSGLKRILVRLRP